MSPLRHRTIRAETDTWQLIRFQFKESSNIPFLSTGVFFFFYRQSFASLATFPLHMVSTWPSCQKSREALGPSTHSGSQHHVSSLLVEPAGTAESF